MGKGRFKEASIDGHSSWTRLAPYFNELRLIIHSSSVSIVSRFKVREIGVGMPSAQGISHREIGANRRTA